MKNNFINGYRKRKTQPQHVELDELRDAAEESWAPDMADAGSDGSGSFEGEIDENLSRAINSLSHDYKMALLLIDIQGHTYQEVADLLAIPVGTVMSRLYRGRKKIEKALLAYGTKYNYLRQAPRKSRDTEIDLDHYFERSTMDSAG
jgi:RNA polymerase sigma-70 factor (ECF subfamily)